MTLVTIYLKVSEDEPGSLTEGSRSLLRWIFVGRSTTWNVLIVCLAAFWHFTQDCSGFFNCRFRSLIVQLLDHGRDPAENLEQGLGWHFLFISRWEFPWRYHRAVIQLINVICHWVWRHRSSDRPGSALWDRRWGTAAPSQQPPHCHLPPSLPPSLLSTNMWHVPCSALGEVT